MSKICPQCEKENQSVANVCMFCGTRLVEDEEIDKIDKLHGELSEAQDTIKLLKETLKEKQKEKEDVKPERSLVHPVVPISTSINKLTEQSKQKIPEKEHFPKSILIVALALLFSVLVGVGYFGFYRPYVIDRDAPRFYTIAVNTLLRSSEEPGVEYNKLGTIPYSSELITYSNGTEWSNVKWINLQTGESIKGYISSKLIVSADDFHILNKIWGDNDSKEVIATSKCRIALLNYFKEKKYSGEWQVFSKPKNVTPNTVYYDRIVNKNSKFTDFAVIIKNINSGEQKLLVFSFDDDETAHLMLETEASTDMSNIKKITINERNGNYEVAFVNE